MKKRALILSGIPWDTTIQRHHKIAFLLDKLGYEVYFVEKIPSSKFTVKKLFNRIKNMYQKRNNKIIVNRENIKVINQKFINPMKGLYWTINKYNAVKLVEKIGSEFDVVINYLPVNITSYILDNIQAKLRVYDCVRDFENWGGYPKDINLTEKEMVLKSDIVLTDSYYLTNKVNNKYRASHVLQILPTVDQKQFSILRESKLKNEIKSILYFGAVGSHIDIYILNKLAQEGYQVHIIGDVEQGIILNEKIINHGFISDAELLAKKIVEYTDALIIPYKGNMDGVIPAKLMQCISTGLPIFINKFYDSEKLNQYLYVYENYDELTKLINQYDSILHKKIAEEMHNFSIANSTEQQFIKLKSVFEFRGTL